MYIKDGKKITLDRDLTVGEGDDAITYPAASLQNAELRAELGIVEVADPVRPDDRFYWVSENADGSLSVTPKEIEQLKADLIAAVKRTANALLSPSDWQVMRKIERGIEVDADVRAYRAAVITADGENEAAIRAAKTVDALAAFVSAWPAQLGQEVQQ